MIIGQATNLKKMIKIYLIERKRKILKNYLNFSQYLMKRLFILKYPMPWPFIKNQTVCDF
jgi:hypothetical protein